MNFTKNQQPMGCSMADNTRYLIIGCGGTGADALLGVKQQFEAALPKEQLEERVRFLVIDTDRCTQRKQKMVFGPDGSTAVIEQDVLTNDQFVHLAGSPARMCLDDTKVAEWINPRHKMVLKEDWSQLDGTGAGGIRQTGRLAMYPAPNIAAVTTKVRKRVAELTNNTHFPLQVFILTGIAGGTGSGAVIDLTYLIRNTVESMPGNLDNPGCFVPARSQYCGFILLPPTGVSTDPWYVDRGNRNGYAAMKEINYFMGIRERGDSYEMTYGNGQRVCSQKNIFDECWLVGDTGGIVFSDPREVAINDLAATLLNRVAHTGVSSDRIKPYSELPALNWVRDARMSYEYALRSSSSAGLHLSETQQGDWRDFPDLLTRDK